MASSQIMNPVFPLEIWPLVFGNFRWIEDLVHLWTEGRRVSKHFKYDVEHVFVKKHLTKTTLMFQIGGMYRKEYWGPIVRFGFHFDHLANEDGKAIFKANNHTKEYMSEVMRRVTCRIVDSSIEHPAHLISFCNIVNDTEVPDLTIHEELREIRFDWRAMFSHFLAEEKLKRDHFGPNLRRKGHEVESDESDQAEPDRDFLALVMRATDESEKTARRARIERQWEAIRRKSYSDEDFASAPR